MLMNVKEIWHFLNQLSQSLMSTDSKAGASAHARAPMFGRIGEAVQEGGHEEAREPCASNQGTQSPLPRMATWGQHYDGLQRGWADSKCGRPIGHLPRVARQVV
jgi:hypothetical protein